MQNGCSVALLGLVALVLLAGALVFLVNLDDIEASRASAAWASAARAEARAELAAERRAGMTTVVMAVLAIFGLSIVSVWLLAGLMLFRDSRQASAPVVYILADSRRQALDQMHHLGLTIDDRRALVVVDGNYSEVHRRL